MMQRIIHGDCLAVMATMDAASVDAIVTDPPYELGFMGKSWDRSGVAFSPETWAACLRVLKPGGHLLAFGGTRTFHRIAVAIEDAGFEIKDTLSWLHGQGFPKHKSLLKPGWEPIIMARKPGASVLNIDDCRISGDMASAHYGGIQSSGSDTFGQIVGKGYATKPHAAGRWPANVILDEVAAALLDEQSGERGSTLKKRYGGQTRFGKHGIYSDGPNGEVFGYGDTGGASRFYYCAKASTSERNAGLDTRCSHPTVKPLSLMRWLVKLVTPPGGLVLDPFTGSGSTGCAAALEGRGFIGIEQDAEYVAIAEWRIAYWTPESLPQMSLPMEVA